MDKKENFFDLDKFAGEGNIGHMLQQVENLKCRKCRKFI